MISVDSLTKEWLDIALSKPALIGDIEAKWAKLKISKPEEYKYVWTYYIRSNLLDSISSMKHGLRS